MEESPVVCGNPAGLWGRLLGVLVAGEFVDCLPMRSLASHLGVELPMVGAPLALPICLRCFRYPEARETCGELGQPGPAIFLGPLIVVVK